jgi:hypothetical protein
MNRPKQNKKKRERDRWWSAEITPVLPTAGQKLPPQFAEYSTIYAVFRHIYLFIYFTISREAPNDVLRRESTRFVALTPTYRTIRYHTPRDHNPTRSLGFDSRPVNGGFVIDKVAIGQIHLRVLRPPPTVLIPPLPHTQISFIYHRSYTQQFRASLNKTLPTSLAIIRASLFLTPFRYVNKLFFSQKK